MLPSLRRATRIILISTTGALMASVSFAARPVKDVGPVIYTNMILVAKANSESGEIPVGKVVSLSQDQAVPNLVALNVIDSQGRARQIVAGFDIDGLKNTKYGERVAFSGPDCTGIPAIEGLDATPGLGSNLMVDGAVIIRGTSGVSVWISQVPNDPRRIGALCDFFGQSYLDQNGTCINQALTPSYCGPGPAEEVYGDFEAQYPAPYAVRFK